MDMAPIGKTSLHNLPILETERDICRNRNYVQYNSLVFFYLNYDNPISEEQEKCALAGCAIIRTSSRLPQDFHFSKSGSEKERGGPMMQNSPTTNWGIQISYDFEGSGIRLPYHEWGDYIAEHPEESEKLEEIKVLIEERSLVFGFKSQQRRFRLRRRHQGTYTRRIIA